MCTCVNIEQLVLYCCIIIARMCTLLYRARVSYGRMVKVKASSPKSTTNTARLCALQGLPGSRLGHFFGGSIDSELEAAHPL